MLTLVLVLQIFRDVAEIKESVQKLGTKEEDSQ